MAGERRGESPVEGLGGESARRDHHGGPLRRPVLARPYGARDRRPVPRREQDRSHEPVAVLLPVIEADVPRAFELAVRAEVLSEVTLGVGGDDLRVVDQVLRVLLCHPCLELRPQREVDLRSVIFEKLVASTTGSNAPAAAGAQRSTAAATARLVAYGRPRFEANRGPLHPLARLLTINGRPSAADDRRRVGACQDTTVYVSQKPGRDATKHLSREADDGSPTRDLRLGNWEFAVCRASWLAEAISCSLRSAWIASESPSSGHGSGHASGERKPSDIPSQGGPRLLRAGL